MVHVTEEPAIAILIITLLVGAPLTVVIAISPVNVTPVIVFPVYATTAPVVFPTPFKTAVTNATDIARP